MMPRVMNTIQCFVFNFLLTLTLPSPKGRGGFPSPLGEGLGMRGYIFFTK
jgi:hypothetical protein